MAYRSRYRPRGRMSRRFASRRSMRRRGGARVRRIGYRM
jgi:hypothetical protein